MTEIYLEAVDGGTSIRVPNEKTVIGRGPLLQVRETYLNL